MLYNMLGWFNYLRRGDEIIEVCQLQHTAEDRSHIHCRKVFVVYFCVVKSYSIDSTPAETNLTVDQMLLCLTGISSHSFD